MAGGWPLLWDEVAVANGGPCGGDKMIFINLLA